MHKLVYNVKRQDFNAIHVFLPKGKSLHQTCHEVLNDKLLPTAIGTKCTMMYSLDTTDKGNILRQLDELIY